MSTPAPVSLCMIVRNEEAALPDALASFTPWVREIVVVDTGSTDATIRIAQQAGARIEHFAWCDDFGTARNVGIDAARQPWVLVMDADDRVLPNFGKRLKAICADAGRVTAGYVLQAREEDRAGNVLRVVYQGVRLFRNTPALRFGGRVHEHLPHTGFLWEQLGDGPHFSHFGHDPAILRDKLLRNRRLELLMVEDNPNDLDALFELVRVHTPEGLNDERELRKWLARCVLADPSRQRLLPRQWAYLDNL